MTDPRRERLERILAEVEATRASGASPTPPPQKKRRRGGLLDLIAVAAAVYTMVVATPVGGLVERGIHWAMGKRVHTRPLVAYFKTGGGSGIEAKVVEELAKAPARTSPTAPAARRAGVDPEMARALALLLSDGRREGEHFVVTLPPAAAASFAAVGATVAPAEAAAKVKERSLIAGLGRLKADLRSEEAAVAALAVDLARVRYAMRRARAAGDDEPERYAGFRAYLPPDDRAEADPLVNGTFALVTAFGMTWPAPRRARISSSFGWRTHPVLGTRKLHTGVDIAVPTGTPLKAVARGKVLYTAVDGVNGRFLKIDHGHGLTSIYCHNDEVLVRRGQRVDAGEVVSKSGATGRVSGPHLHFQMELDGEPIDPELFGPKRRPALIAPKPTETSSRAVGG